MRSKGISYTGRSRKRSCRMFSNATGKSARLLGRFPPDPPRQRMPPARLMDYESAPWQSAPTAALWRFRGDAIAAKCARSIARAIRRKMKIKTISERVLGVFALDVAHEHVVQLLEGFYAALAATVVAMKTVVSQDFGNRHDASRNPRQSRRVPVGSASI